MRPPGSGRGLPHGCGSDGAQWRATGAVETCGACQGRFVSDAGAFAAARPDRRIQASHPDNP